MEINIIVIKILIRISVKLHMKYVSSHLFKLKHKLRFSKIRKILSNNSITIENALTSINNNYTKGKCPIWIIWLQGESQMPTIVKSCYNRVKDVANEHPINLITDSNLKKYTKSKDVLLPWNDSADIALADGRIDFTKFSDILRCWLLYNWGGIYLDATVYITEKKIDNIINNFDFWTGVHYADNKKNEFCVNGKWTGFFLYSNPRNSLFKYIYEAMHSILKHDGKYKEYFTIDYIFMLAYNSSAELRQLIDKIPISSDLITKFPYSAIYSKESWDEYMDATQFYKLSWKIEPTKIIGNGNTFFSHLLELSSHDV